MTTGEQDLSAQARHDLDAVAATTRQMRLLRMLHGLGPLLMLWGVVLLLGNGVHALLARGHEALLEYWWLALVIVGILLTGAIERRKRLHTVEAWRLWGAMLLLLIQGWVLFHLITPPTPAQGAIYVSGLILVGWGMTALLFRAPIGFCYSVALLLLTYGGYHLLRPTVAHTFWIAGGAGAIMLATGLLTLAWEQRLMGGRR